MKIVTADHIRRIEAAADANGLSYVEMMDRAGHAAAQVALDMLTSFDDEVRVTILVGAGNNGGDGLVCGRYIAERHDNEQVRFYLLKRRDEDDPLMTAIQEAELFVAYAGDDRDNRVLVNMIASADLVIDALFGIGVRLPIKDDAANLLRRVKSTVEERRDSPATVTSEVITPAFPQADERPKHIQVLAIDCPSGLNCDNGEVDSNTIPADVTITFIAPKPGLLTYPGAESVGELKIAPIGLPDNLDEFDEPTPTLAAVSYVKQLLPARSSGSHKGSHGKAMIVAGSVNYTGAAGLSAMGAYRAGAGLVTVATPGPVVSALAAHHSEPTWTLLPHDMGVISEKAVHILRESLDGYAAMLIGPGLGQEDTTGDFLTQLLEKPKIETQIAKRRPIGFGTVVENISDDDADEKKTTNLPPLVMDADALNLLAKQETWWELLPANTIITPHPGEMSRLTGMKTSEIQANRWKIAKEKADAWDVILLLKGAHTVIAAPSHEITVLPFKNDALATAGTGDVLAGIIVGLLAQGVEPYAAAVAGAYIHGLCGQRLAMYRSEGRALIASDLLAEARHAFAQIG